jgi:hypothetical protein
MTSPRKETHHTSRWLSSPPTTVRDVFSSSPSSETASPLIRTVFRSPYYTDPSSHFSSPSTTSTSISNTPASISSTPQRYHSSAKISRTARFVDNDPFAQTPRSRSAPSTLARPSYTRKTELTMSPLSRDSRSERMPSFSPASAHQTQSSAGKPVVLESNDGGRIYVARQVYEVMW